MEDFFYFLRLHTVLTKFALTKACSISELQGELLTLVPCK